MSFLSLHHRDSDGRATRLAGAAVLMLAIIAVASAVLGARLGLWGQGANRPRRARDVADAGAGVVPGDPAVVDGEGQDAGAWSRRLAAGDGDAGLADGSGSGRPDSAHQRDGGDEDLLAVWDHLERQIDAAMTRARESVVALEYTAGDASAGTRRVASGVVISHRCEILSVRIDPPRPRGSSATATPSQDPAPIVARDYLGRCYVAHWLAADSYTGLTLLMVAPRTLRPIRKAAEGPKLGSRVFVVGNPFGMGHSVSPGHVAGLDRALELGPRQLGGLIQVQAPLYPGDSGAAVVDVRGGWLGLIRGGLAIPSMGSRPSSTDPSTDPGSSAKAPTAAVHSDVATDDTNDDDAADRSADPDTDFGFAIPTRDALWIADQLRTHGRVDRAYLGVQFETARVSAGPIAVAEPASSAAAAASPSSSAPAVPGAWRGIVGTPDSSEPAAASAEPDRASVSRDGARLREVVPDTPAARAGLRPGDRIVAVDGQPIRSRNDLIDRLDRIPARRTIVLGVVRESEPSRPPFDVTVRTSSRPRRRASGPDALQAAPSESRPVGAGVTVTPTASRGEPASADPSSSSSTSGRSNTTSAPAREDRPGPSSADPPATAPRQDPPSAPPSVPPAPDRAEPVPPASVPLPALNDLRLTLPRAVERIEQLERRIQELEQFRAVAAATREPGPKPQPDRTKAPVGRKP